eukprot:s2001_g4.t1
MDTVIPIPTRTRYSQTQSQPAQPQPAGTSLSVAELLGLGSAGPPVRGPAQVPEHSEPPVAPEEAFQRPELLAGHLGGLSALQGHAAVAAMHVSRWQEAMNIAAARGDRATYEAAARARYEAAMYHQALQHASFEALYAEAGRLEGFASPGIEAAAGASASGRTHWTGMGEDTLRCSACARRPRLRHGHGPGPGGPGLLLERKEQQKVALFRPTLMENSYNALRAAPLVPGAQPPTQLEGRARPRRRFLSLCGDVEGSGGVPFR